jgi:flavin-dependent dehydrogenase
MIKHVLNVANSYLAYQIIQHDTFKVENLLVEAKYKVYQQKSSAEIDFEEFVKLYLNHRPAFCDNVRRIRHAFRNFAYMDKEAYVISRNDFVEMLVKYGM